MAGLPVGCLLLGADAKLQITEFSRGKIHGSGAASGGRATGADRAGAALMKARPPSVAASPAGEV